MSHSLYLILSKPPAEISPDEYERWYHHHVRENIVVPGFLGAQRFAIERVMAGSLVAPGRFEQTSDQPAAPINFTHLAAYEYTGDIQKLRAALFKRIEAGEAPLPKWFRQIEFETWNCRPIEERVEPAAYSGRWGETVS